MNSNYAPKQFKAEEWKDNLKDFSIFYKQLHFSEFNKLLKDIEFKKFLCDNLTNVNYVEIVRYLDENDTFLLIDENFVNFLQTKDEKSFAYLYERLDKDVFGELILKQGFEGFINFSALSARVHKTWSIDVKKRILSLAIDNNVSNQVLARLTKNIYYENYDKYLQEENVDYSRNEREVKMISELLENRDDVGLKYYNDYDLLASLDPENRSNFFLYANYKNLLKSEKNNLLQLLSDGYKTVLPDSILSDAEFYKDVANLKAKEFRVARLMVKDLSEKACEGIDLERYKIASKNMAKISDMSFEQIKSADVNLDDMLENICYAYFRCSSRDVLIKACLIKDAMNTFPEFEQKFTKDGIFLIDKLVDMLKSQEEFVVSAKREEGQNLIVCNKENFDDLKDVVSVLCLKNNWKGMFDKAEEVARKQFSKDLSKQLYVLDERDLIPNDEGLKIFDITKHKKFHLLVHGKLIYKFENYKFPNVGDGGYLNTSTSVLNNNHWGTFVDEIDSPYKLDENGIVFGYCSVEEDEVKHALPSDAFTNLIYASQKVNTKFEKLESAYAPTYIPLKDIMGNTHKGVRGFNEIKLHRKANKGKQVVPDYILCRNEIREVDKEFSKKHGIPIVFVNVNEVQKFAENDVYKPILYDNSTSFGGVRYRDLHIEQ